LSKPAIASEDLRSTTMDYIVGGVATAFLFAYLLYALVRPEKF
jgi:K+-transporting ATPase KdpF subunit